MQFPALPTPFLFLSNLPQFPLTSFPQQRTQRGWGGVIATNSGMVVVSHHELYVLLHLFLGGVIATDEDRVIIAAEGNIIVREDLVDIPGFTLPEDLSENCIVHPVKITPQICFLFLDFCCRFCCCRICIVVVNEFRMVDL